MSPAAPLSRELFLTVVEHTPLVSVDLICRDEQDRILLGLRNNRPAQGSWFVPGGRIAKDERVADALQRVVARELGLALEVATARPLGVFQHLYADNFADAPGISTHYVVLAYEIRIGAASALAIDPQHSELRWFSLAELLASAQVHDYTKAYFDPSIRTTCVP